MIRSSKYTSPCADNLHLTLWGAGQPCLVRQDRLLECSMILRRSKSVVTRSP